MKQEAIKEILIEELDITEQDADAAAVKIAEAARKEKEKDVRLLAKKTEAFIKQISKQLKLVKP